MYSTFWPCVIKSCSKFAVDPTYRSRVGVTTMSHWLPAPICMLFKGKGVKFRLSNLLRSHKKALPWPELAIQPTYWACGTFKDATSDRGEKTKKALSCIKLAICTDHPRRHGPLKLCMRGRVSEVVTFQVSWKSVQGSRSYGGGVENHPLPLTRPMANTTAVVFPL